MTEPDDIAQPQRLPAAEAASWAPRLAQERRLAALDRLRAGEPPDDPGLDHAIERAALLGALDRHDDARAAFIDILRKAPTDFSALNEFGALLTRIGAVDAARRLYAEAIAHHPDNPVGHVNLANLLLRSSDHQTARAHYETALRIAPGLQAAHQGLGAVLSDLGEHAAARLHFQQGFRDCAVSTLPYRGTGAPIEVLQLVSSGGGNIPTAPFMDDRTFLTTVVVADHLAPDVPLPRHRVVFNAIGDADLCRPALDAAVALVARTTAPVINPPGAIFATGRVATTRRLGALPDVVAPRIVALPRDVLVGTAAAALAEHGFGFPLLLRSPGYHTGRNFVRVDAVGHLPDAVAALPGDDLLVIEYLDARGDDGQSRKYRVMFIDGAIYPLHLAISRNWKVHYFTADMAERADHRREEAAFLDDMPAALGARAMTALARIWDTMGLDYAGIDFGVSRSGELLLFEANATMVVAPPTEDPRWAYRRAAIRRVLDAVVAMIRTRAA